MVLLAFSSFLHHVSMYVRSSRYICFCTNSSCENIFEMYVSSYTLFTEAVQRKKETCHRKQHVSCHLPPELRGLNIGSMNGLSFHVQRCHLRSFPDSRRGGRKRILNELAVANVYQRTSREGDGYHCQRYSESRIHDGGKMELINDDERSGRYEREQTTYHQH
jgi:hypothetical protein